MRRSPYLAGLLLIAAVCGLVDAACFIGLGAVFAEIMTGNILLLAFRIGTGHPIGEATPLRYLAAILAFAIGALAGGLLMRGADTSVERRIGFGLELTLVVLATTLAFATSAGESGTGRDLVVGILAGAMGLQNALMRKHGVADVATNVMTLTFAGLLSESKLVGGSGRHWARRAGSIGIFFVSAIVGAYLIRFGAGWPLAVAAVLLAAAVVLLTTNEPPVEPAHA